MPACRDCLRRAWLLEQLGPVLDYVARDRGRLHAALALGDDQLIDALAGRRRAALREAYGRFDPGDAPAGAGVETVCRHHRGFPERLRGVAVAPAMLYVRGDPARLTAQPVVAMLGGARASDYGRETAREIARSLTASGVTIVSGHGGGVADAAHAGAREAGGASVAVLAGGLRATRVARSSGTPRERLAAGGCAVSELPCRCPARRWAQPAAERIVVALCEAAVVVEADSTPRELGGAGLAAELGRLVAALPGRVSSPLSAGPHELIADGRARLVRDAGDVLDMLGRPQAARAERAAGPDALAPRLRAVLELVASGADTPDRLAAAGADTRDLLARLTELELLGLLRRGANGRYAARGLAG